MANVTLQNVQKSYGEVSVIDDLNLEIQDGEFMVLVGPSGCGKSTALRMIAGLEEITGGEVKIDGGVVNDLPPKDRDIAMVFQSYALYPHMTVRQNLEFGLKIRKMKREEIDRLVQEAAEILDIDQLLDRRPKQLSGGQRQRVAVGRAIVRKPKVFLFDEPLSNLDAKLRVQMRAELSKLHSRLQTTTVYVTHDQVEAMTMGNRIAVLKDGDLMQVGTPLELFQQPQNLFVANFIGTPPMNFLDAVVAEGGRVLRAEGADLPVPESWSRAVAGRDGDAIAVGVRPTDFYGPGETADGDTAALDLQVEVVEPLGHEVMVHGTAGPARLVVNLGPHSIPRLGETLEVRVKLSDLHLFDPETEQRLSSD
ncbi:MAG: sn-glycerol-3-phosphate ABC transporter ATP-binding protein UgpC [Acidobacteriota bacterium]